MIAIVGQQARMSEDDPKFDTSQDISDFAYNHYAELLGL